MINSLPRGLFSIPKNSGFSTSQVYSLIKICEDLHRQIVVLTDLPIDRDSDANEVVMLNPELSEGDLFEYTFSTGEPGHESSAIDGISMFTNDLTWKCWMPKRDGVTPVSDAISIARDIISSGFECACIPSVEVKIGPLRDMFINSDGPITSIMIPNSGEGFWREVFRSSGYYGAKARAIVQRAV